jgi:hypothetical protein
MKFNRDPAENLAHALAMEDDVTVPTDALVDNNFATDTATHLLPQITTAQGGVDLCP